MRSQTHVCRNHPSPKTHIYTYSHIYYMCIFMQFSTNPTPAHINYKAICTCPSQPTPHSRPHKNTRQCGPPSTPSSSNGRKSAPCSSRRRCGSCPCSLAWRCMVRGLYKTHICVCRVMPKGKGGRGAAIPIHTPTTTTTHTHTKTTKHGRDKSIPIHTPTTKQNKTHELYTGVGFDTPAVPALRTALLEKQRALQQEIHALAGVLGPEQFNVESPEQV